jgi:hypothetical protein
VVMKSSIFWRYNAVQSVESSSYSETFGWLSMDYTAFQKIERFISVVVKVKLSLCLTNFTLRHEDVWGTGYIDLHLLDLSNSWRSVVSFTTRPLYPRYLLNRWLGEPQSRSGRCGENSSPYRDSNSDLSVIQPVASRYTGSLFCCRC